MAKRKRNKDREIIELAEAGANDSSLILFDRITEVEDDLSDTDENVASLDDAVKTLQRNLVTEIKEGGKLGQAIKETEIERIAMKVAVKLVDIERGDDGHTPTREELLDLIDPLIPAIPTVVEGKKGDTPIRGTDYWTDADKKAIIDAVFSKIPIVEAQSGNDLITIINEENTNKKIKMERIEGLSEALQKRGQGVQAGGVVSGRELFADIDISSQLDGATKTFDIQTIYKIITVDLSSFPYALRKTTDYTFTSTSITFTSEIDAVTQLSAGTTCILTVVLG